ncbi:hypothetical protein C8Q80DRAFT_1203378 [Daedaleopsis nitida]|nr:hypothetical protein C8Q80DRAFT_1203378 [Daedaleopsis nitida]
MPSLVVAIPQAQARVGHTAQHVHTRTHRQLARPSRQQPCTPPTRTSGDVVTPSPSNASSCRHDNT